MEKEDVSIAMDIFKGLDNAHYDTLQLETLNEMYLLANQGLKTTGTGQSG